MSDVLNMAVLSNQENIDPKIEERNGKTILLVSGDIFLRLDGVWVNIVQKGVYEFELSLAGWCTKVSGDIRLDGESSRSLPFQIAIFNAASGRKEPIVVVEIAEAE